MHRTRKFHIQKGQQIAEETLSIFCTKIKVRKRAESSQKTGQSMVTIKAILYRQRLCSLTQLGVRVERHISPYCSRIASKYSKKKIKKIKKTIKISNKTFCRPPSLLGGPQGKELLQPHLHRTTGYGNAYPLLPSYFLLVTQILLALLTKKGSVLEAEQTGSKPNWSNVVLEMLQCFAKASPFCLGHFLSPFSCIVSIIIKNRFGAPGEKM